jgi:hypothetical protein
LSEPLISFYKYKYKYDPDINKTQNENTHKRWKKSTRSKLSQTHCHQESECIQDDREKENIGRVFACSGKLEARAKPFTFGLI